MSRNNVIEELTLYLFCPGILGPQVEATIALAIEQTREEISKKGTVTDGNW